MLFESPVMGNLNVFWKGISKLTFSDSKRCLKKRGLRLLCPVFAWGDDHLFSQPSTFIDLHLGAICHKIFVGFPNLNHTILIPLSLQGL